MAWQKGQSGNPAGRSKDKVWADAIRIAVNESAGDRRRLRALADKLVEEALSGNMQAMKEIGDRLDGKAAQSVDVNITRTPAEMTDDELIEIARGGGAADAPDGSEELPSVH